MSKRRSKFKIQVSNGNFVSAILESHCSHPTAFIAYAHCFSCGKDSLAASRIARSLVAKSYAVLRYDFVGIGESSGEFADTNFSSSVEDLKLIADYLRHHFEAPKILIGHSFGGTVVLGAAADIPEVNAVVTLGAPSEPVHITKQFKEHLHTIEQVGIAPVSLSGRPFTIKKQLLDDLALQSQDKTIGNLKKPLLVFHSPVDETVNIKEAEHIYMYAKHPKSFVSLDNADHLLTNPKDAEYVATTIAAWASRYMADQ